MQLLRWLSKNASFLLAIWAVTLWSSLVTEQRRFATAGEGGEGAEGEGGGQEQETIHRLCPNYASHVNSPLRHVRTRIYFTSESHIHSLVNVLRYCHIRQKGATAATATASRSSYGSGSSSYSNLVAVGSAAAAAAGAASAAAAGGGGGGAGLLPPGESPVAAVTSGPGFGASSGYRRQSSSGSGPFGRGTSRSCSVSPTAGAAAAAGELGQGLQGLPLVCPEGQALLDEADEFDYLTHIVFRMYEDKRVSSKSSWTCLLMCFERSACCSPPCNAWWPFALTRGPKDKCMFLNGLLCPSRSFSDSN
jgi:hypothetical protein